MSKILHLTHPSYNVSSILTKSKLVDNIPLAFSGDEYHTSLGDLSAEEIISIIPNFDTVNFIKDNFDISSDIYHETVLVLMYIGRFVKVTNFEVEPCRTFISPHLISRPDESVLWVFGCSHSQGVGLNANEPRYSDLLSQQLGLTLVSCTQSGSSTSWSLRHLLEADIRPKDLVIWQITIAGRITIAGPATKEIRLAETDNRCLIDVFSDEQIFFNHINLIRAGVKYLRAKKVKFLMISIEDKSSWYYNYLKEYVKYPEYCYTPGYKIDLGTDNLHVGPKSHKRLASILLDRVYYDDAKFI